MKKLSFAKSLVTVGLAAVCAAGIVGCSGGDSDASKPTYTGGVAATVNGTEIQEDTITQAIQDIRAQMNATDEESWGKWMAENDYTPETVREEIINSYVDQELVRQGAAAQEISADDSAVNEYVSQMRGNYDSDEAWAEALQSVGLTEDEYRDNIELSLMTQQLKTKVAENVGDPSDEEVLTSAQAYVSSYTGAKKSSHILFDASDEALAQEVLEKVQSGELDFATAAESYSKDTGSAADGGNVGWDKLTNFVSEYTTALTELDKDQVSGLVPSTYGIHIIKCTDVFTAPEKLESLDQLPVEFQDAIKAMLRSTNESQAYYTWLEEQRNAAEIVINDMPEGLPYWVDMVNYPKSDDSAANIVGVDENGNPVTVDGSETPAEGDAPVEGGDQAAAGDNAGAEGSEGTQPAEGSGDGSDAAADQGAEGAQGEQPADGTAGDNAAADGAGEQPAEGNTGDGTGEGQPTE